MTSIQENLRIYRRLRIVRLVALVDLVLLLALVTAAITGNKELVHVLGPLHGINYLLLLVIVGVAALDGVWGWWFPLAILLTAGPPGAFVGEWIIHRRIGGRPIMTHESASNEPGVITTGEKLDAPESLRTKDIASGQEEQMQ